MAVAQYNLVDSQKITIAAGGTSGVCELDHFPIGAIDVPVLTSTVLSFYGSVDGSTFRRIVGGEWTQLLTNSQATTGNFIIGGDDLNPLNGCRWLMVVCGTTQSSDVVFRIGYHIMTHC